MEKCEKLLNQANKRLKAGRLGVSLEVRGGRLLLRGTFPPKAGSEKTSPYQQRINPKLSYNPAGIQRAEQIAKTIGAQLSTNQFEWGSLEGKRPKKKTVKDWVDEYEKEFWKSRRETQSAKNTWQTYLWVFGSLPMDEPLSIGLIESAVLKYPAGGETRSRHCLVLSRLGKIAGLDVTPIKRLKGELEVVTVNPKTLPTDKVIWATYDRIKTPHWRWVYGMMAFYGLRNHEVFGLDLSEFPTIWTHPDTKTGKRFVYPVPKEIPKDWALNIESCPPIAHLSNPSENWSWARLGHKVSRYFTRSNIPFNAYSLRHSYARRCFESGLRPDLAAKLMGHDMKLHLTTYRSFWEESTYRKEYENTLNSP